MQDSAASGKPEFIVEALRGGCKEEPLIVLLRTWVGIKRQCVPTDCIMRLLAVFKLREEI